MPVRQKLAYIALGGVLVIAGQLLPSVFLSRGTAQGGKPSAEFDTITVRSLKVVDAAGKIRARLEVIKSATPYLRDDVMRVFNDADVPVYFVAVDSEGGSVVVCNNEGASRAMMTVTSGEGSVSVGGKDNKPLAMMTGDSIAVCDKDGQPRATMFVDSDGSGSVVTTGRDGHVTGKLPEYVEWEQEEER